MITGESPLGATMKMREDFLKIAAGYGARLQELRSNRENPYVAVLKGGGMGIIHATLDNGEPGFKLGSVGDKRMTTLNPGLLAKWNRENPNHPVEIVALQDALTRECASVCIFLHTIEERRRALEIQQ